MKVGGLILVSAVLANAGPALAATVRQPSANVGHSVDRGNATGDRRVEALNQQQLESIRGQSHGAAEPSVLGAPLYTPVVPASKDLSQ